MSKNKKHQEDIQDDIVSESGEEGQLSKKDKLTRKQKLMKLFLTTELKNKHLRGSLRDAKSSLIRNFRNGSFQSSDINKLFRIYFNEDKDVFVGKHLKKYLARYTVDMEGTSADLTMTLQQYLSLLEYFRGQTDPFLQKIKPLVPIATRHAREIVREEFSDDTFSDFQAQSENKLFREKTTEKMIALMQPVFENRNLYTLDRFNQEKEHIHDKLVHSDYRSFFIFALLGFHLFDKRQEVLDAFTDEQLDATIDLAFPPDFTIQCPIKLKDMLVFIARLDFKSQFFRMK